MTTKRKFSFTDIALIVFTVGLCTAALLNSVRAGRTFSEWKIPEGWTPKTEQVISVQKQGGPGYRDGRETTNYTTASGFTGMQPGHHLMTGSQVTYYTHTDGRIGDVLSVRVSGRESWDNAWVLMVLCCVWAFFVRIWFM
jgi:hypothetical protein